MDMNEPAKKLLDEALRLSTDDRAALVAELLASLDASHDSDVEAAWAAEIRRRVDLVGEGKAVFEDWDSVKKQLRPEG